MNLIRSTLFWFIASLSMAVAGTLVVLTAVIFRGGPVPYAVIAVWRRIFMGSVHYVLGIRTELRGQDNIPAQPSVYLSRHESAWETVALQDLMPAGQYFVFVLKRELLAVPFFGWGLRAMRWISIDRSSGKDALAQVVTQGKDCLARGLSVIVFPEGTRVKPGERRRYKVGGAHLATRAGCKVIPVAHNAGDVWPRKALCMRPGTIVLSVGPAIDTEGKTDAQVSAEAEAWIEAELRRIAPHRYPDAPATA